MKLIKPLLIYITWIAFVWFCTAYVASDYQIVFGKESFRFMFILVGPISGAGALAIYYSDETNNT